MRFILADRLLFLSNWFCLIFWKKKLTWSKFSCSSKFFLFCFVIFCSSKLYHKYRNYEVMSMDLVLRLWHLYLSSSIFEYRMSHMIKGLSYGWFVVGCEILIWQASFSSLQNDTDFVSLGCGMTGNCFGSAGVDITFLGVLSIQHLPGKLLNVLLPS